MTLSTDFFQTLPVVDETAIDLLLQKEIAKNHRMFVVLDDDPTGVQTVHDISVFTNWDRASILQGFQEAEPLFYILTNSRGLTQEETTLVHKQIAETVDSVAKELHKDYLFISRSDSTLRGHYPLEPELLRESYEHFTGKTIHGEILCPFFKEGGRFTIGNVHYVKYGNELVPANETEFAKDSTFGYTAATLPDYIEEKTKGAFAASDVVCISLDDLRSLNRKAASVCGSFSKGHCKCSGLCRPENFLYCTLPCHGKGKTVPAAQCSLNCKSARRYHGSAPAFP